MTKKLSYQYATYLYTMGLHDHLKMISFQTWYHFKHETDYMEYIKDTWDADYLKQLTNKWNTHI